MQALLKLDKNEECKRRGKIDKKKTFHSRFSLSELRAVRVSQNIYFRLEIFLSAIVYGKKGIDFYLFIFLPSLFVLYLIDALL